MIKIRFTFEVDGALTDPDSVVLADPGETFGVKRLDTHAVVVAANTAMTKVATGVYEHEFEAPAPGLSYERVVRVEFQGAVYHFEREFTDALPPAETPEQSYLSLAEADALADELLDLDAWKSADAAAKARALAVATGDVDAAMRYQGRKLDPDQALEFPRLFDDRHPGSPRGVWDWVPGENGGEAVVPKQVLRAVLHQSDALLAGDREARLASQHDGVVYDQSGGLAESYKQSPGPGRESGLARRAWMLMRKYRLTSGEIT